jgi:multidrug transporter EmrE-like cation transporter
MSHFGLVLLLVSAATTTVANLLLRAGLDRAGGFNLGGLTTTLLSFMRLLAEPYFAVGFVLYFLAALVWFRVISHELLSTAYPIMVGLVFVMVSAGAVLLFREPMSVRKMIGLVVILVGIVIASTSGSA